MLDQLPALSYFAPVLGGLRSSGAPLAQGADQLTRQAHSLSECRVTAASTAMMATAATTIASMTCRLVLMMPRLLPFLLPNAIGWPWYGEGRPPSDWRQKCPFPE